MNRNFIPLFIIVIAAVVALFVLKPSFLALGPEAEEPEIVYIQQSQTREAQRIGVIRPQPELPDGPQDFTISSAADRYPRFASAHIDPLKVAVGDTQFMRVVVQDDVEVTSVVAEIETDNEVVEVPLVLTETSALSRSELMNQKYLVRDGVLVINDGSRETAGIFETFAKRAEAAALKKFTFEGEWVVRDTHVRTYRTTFRAKDELGRENSITMAWSDPCTGITHGQDSSLGANCAIGLNTVDGIDNGNLNLNGKALTLDGTGSVFAWNDGKTITISAGSAISIGDGSELRQTNLWATDADSDGYGPSSGGLVAQDTNPGGYARAGGSGTPTSVTKSPTGGGRVFTGGAVEWSSPGGGGPCCVNVVSSNNAYAQAALAASGFASRLTGESFDMQIPLNSTIQGIKVEIEKRYSGSGIIEDHPTWGVKIMTRGEWSASRYGGDWPTADTYVTYGGPTDLWGLTELQPAVFNHHTQLTVGSVRFRVSIQARNRGAASATAYVDHIRATIYYTTPLILSSTPDCYDGNVLARPNIPISLNFFYLTSRGDGNFDYDCNGVQEQGITDIGGGCDGGCGEFDGWLDSPAPACGVTTDYENASCELVEDEETGEEECIEDTSTALEIQECR